MGAIEILPETFEETAGRSLDDFVKMMRSRPLR
jgi:hypothetical protein